MKLNFQNEAKYLTQKFVNYTKSFLPGGKADMYFSFFPYKNKEIFYGAVLIQTPIQSMKFTKRLTTKDFNDKS